MKTGDKVIVPAEINGYGRDLQAMVTEIEKFAGTIFVTVVFTEPCPGSLTEEKEAFTMTSS
ncbi:hypothetical protein ACIXTS_22415 [Bacteroides fragilis]